MKRREIGKVIQFDDNLGRGVIRLIESGQRLKITHRDIVGDGFVVLIEGELVEVEQDDGRIRVWPLRKSTDG